MDSTEAPWTVSVCSGLSEERLGSVLDRLGSVLGRPGTPSWHLGERLGALCVRIEASSERFGGSWKRLGTSWGRPGASRGATWRAGRRRGAQDRKLGEGIPGEMLKTQYVFNDSRPRARLSGFWT